MRTGRPLGERGWLWRAECRGWAALRWKVQGKCPKQRDVERRDGMLERWPRAGWKMLALI